MRFCVPLPSVHSLTILIAKAADWNRIESVSDRILSRIQEHYECIKEVADSGAAHANDQSPPYRHPIFPVLVIEIPENPGFFGRHDTLSRMHSHLDPAHQAHKFRCFTIHGMGGIGKTQIAASYAYKHCKTDGHSSYDAVLWVNSETQANIRKSFATIATALCLPEINERTDPSVVLNAVHIWLKQSRKSWRGRSRGPLRGDADLGILDKKWLMIFDNVERWDDILSDFWPQAGAKGAVIVTSRDFHLAQAPASAGEHLETFSASESLQFAQSILKDWDSDSEKEVKALQNLLAWLDGLPLAIYQISNRINAEGSNIHDFLEHYSQHADEWHRNRGGDHNAFYHHTLETVWSYAVDNFSKVLESRLILGSICLISPDQIPEKLFLVHKDLALPQYAIRLQNHHS